jgi:glycosyltransferase involved in cell wall biosynthesis
MAQQLGIADRVHFLGWQQDALKLLAAADIYCQPNTVAEPFGITFIESLYAQRPVITTSMGGPKEIIDDSCGILVPPDNVPALTDSLRQLIGDQLLRAKLGEAGPSRARLLCDPSGQMFKLQQLLMAI